MFWVDVGARVYGNEMEMKEMVFFETQFCILKGVSCGDQCIVNIGFLKSLFQLN